MSEPTAPDLGRGAAEPQIAVALSGGGHRASLWGAGALLALCDAGLNPRVTSISSVSGGSIANGLIAARLDYRDATFDTLRTALAEGIEEWSTRGLFFTGPATDRYVGRFLTRLCLLATLLVATVFAIATWGRTWSVEVATAVATAVAVVLVGGALLATRTRGPSFTPSGHGLAAYRSSVVAPACASGPITWLAIVGATDENAGVAAVTVAGAVVATVVAARWTIATFAKRSQQVDSALAAGVLRASDDGGPLLLADLRAARSVHHVFCATDLTSGDHCYLSPELVYSHRRGLRRATGLPLSTAVQASACLPGAFAPRLLSKDHVSRGTDGDPFSAVLTDGGVYDNMADQWAFGLPPRRVRLAEAGHPVDDAHLRPPDHLLVVNASGPMGHHRVATGGLVGEVATLLACKDVLYDVSTAVRRRYLVDMFERARSDGHGLRGALVQITQEPRRVPTRLAIHGPEEVRPRAREALAFLDRLEAVDGVDWRSVSEANAAVPTTLGPVGADAATSLLHHAYVLTRINVYVLLGLGTPPCPEDLDPWRRSRFAPDPT